MSKEKMENNIFPPPQSSEGAIKTKAEEKENIRA